MDDTPAAATDDICFLDFEFCGSEAALDMAMEDWRWLKLDKDPCLGCGSVT